MFYITLLLCFTANFSYCRGLGFRVATVFTSKYGLPGTFQSD